MSVSGQVLTYLKVLAWPVTALVALVIFRVAIRGLLGGIQELEGFGIRAKIGRQVVNGITSAAAALAESPVGSAVSVNHGQSPVSRTTRSGRAPSLPIFVISQAQSALAVSSRLAKPDPGLGDDTAEAMRSYLNWLDTAVTAVVTVLATADPSEPNLVPPELNGEVRAGLTAQRIERLLSEATGVSGWHGVIESRDILRSTVVLVCGQGSAAVSRADARRFVMVVIRSLDHWQNLVKQASEVAGQAVPVDG